MPSTFAVFAVGGLANWSGGALGDRIGRERTAIAMLAVSGTCAATIGLLMTAPLWLLIGGEPCVGLQRRR